MRIKKVKRQMKTICHDEHLLHSDWTIKAIVDFKFVTRLSAGDTFCSEASYKCGTTDMRRHCFSKHETVDIVRNERLRIIFHGIVNRSAVSGADYFFYFLFFTLPATLLIYNWQGFHSWF